MEHIPQDDIIQIGLSAYRTVGESMTRNKSLLLSIYRFLNITIMIITLIAILVNLFHVQGGMYIRTVEGSLTVIHVSYFLVRDIRIFRTNLIWNF